MSNNNGYLRDLPTMTDRHEFHETEGKLRCKVCLKIWKQKPRHGMCAGRPVYLEWRDVPEHLASQTRVSRDFKLKRPKGMLPAAYKLSHQNWHTALYDTTKCKPKKRLSKKGDS